MLRILLLAAAIAVTACGKDDGSDSSSTDSAMQGDWYYADAPSHCVLILNVANTDYEYKQVCETSASTANIEIEDGTLATDAGNATFTPTRSTCADMPVATVPYKASENQLNVTLGTTIVVMRKIQPSDATDNGFALTTGCFNADGTFTPRALAP